MVARPNTGEIFEVRDWIPTQTLGDIHSLRPKLRQTDGEGLVCQYCGNPVLLKKHENGGHYFAHKEKSAADRAACLYQDGRSVTLADLNRMRFHGQREGARHRRTKDLIDRILRADSRFATPEIERRWTSFSDGWRKPDVGSAWNGTKVVFEAQVSNTYPQVVAERTEFYRKQGALLIWIFDQLPDDAWRTLHADTFCANQQHLFIVDDECMAESERTHRAMFRCYSLRPDVSPVRRPAKGDSEDGKTILEHSFTELFGLVAFDSLSLDVERQTACLFDAKEEKRRAHHKILCATAQASQSQDDHHALEAAVRDHIGRKNQIPPKSIEGWAVLVCAIEARRLGHPVGTKLANVAGVLNLVHDRHPGFFVHLVKTLERLGIDPANERTGAWKNRVRAFHNGVYCGGPVPSEHSGSVDLLRWLYPS